MTVLINEVAYTGQVRGIARERCGDGLLERGATVGVEQLDESAGEHAEMLVALGGVVAAMALRGKSHDEPADRTEVTSRRDRAEKVNVVATTGMIADAVREVGGDAVQVSALMGEVQAALSAAASAPPAGDGETKSALERVRQLRRKLELALRAQHADLSDRLAHTRQGSRTLRAYRESTR